MNFGINAVNSTAYGISGFLCGTLPAGRSGRWAQAISQASPGNRGAVVAGIKVAPEVVVRYSAVKPFTQGAFVVARKKASRKVASAASEVQSSPKSTAAQNRVAASALTQVRDKPKGKKQLSQPIIFLQR